MDIGYIIVVILFILAVILQGLYFFWQYAVFTVAIIIYLCLMAYRKKVYIGGTVAFSLCILSVLYIISIFRSINAWGAAQEAVKSMGYVPAFLVGLWSTGEQEDWIGSGIIISGVLVSLVGLTALSGLIKIPGALYGIRMQSTFGYANVTGVYLMLGIILSLKSIAESKYILDKTNTGHIFQRMVNSLSIYFLTCGLILTYSRIVWMLFAIWSGCVLFSGAFLNQYCHKWQFLYITLTAIVTTIFLASDFKGTIFWIILFIGAIFCGMFVVVDRDLFYYFGNIRRWKFYILLRYICIIIIVFLSVLFFAKSHLYERIADIRLNATEWQARMGYYKGALRLIKEHLFWGVGARGWELLCESYVGNYVKYVHSYPLQVICDVGLVGFIMLIIFIVGTVNKFCTCKKKDWYNLTVPLTILLHSLLDVDMHFQLIAFIFFIYCGIIVKKGKFQGAVKL